MGKTFITICFLAMCNITRIAYGAGYPHGEAEWRELKIRCPNTPLIVSDSNSDSYYGSWRPESSPIATWREEMVNLRKRAHPSVSDANSQEVYNLFWNWKTQFVFPGQSEEEKTSDANSDANSIEFYFSKLPNEPGECPTSSILIVPDGTIITGNVTWDPDMYSAVYISGDVLIAAGAMLTCEGHTIWYSYDNCANITVQTGGGIRFIGNFLFPDYHDPGYPYNSIYPWAIKLEPGVSANSEISFNYVFGAFRGIFNLNNKLNFHDNKFRGCDVGIGQYGPALADVKNNSFIDIYGIDGVPIGQHPEDITGVYVSSKTKNEISNNTISWASWGIVAHGTQNPEDAGKLLISNNLTTKCGTGIAWANGWLMLCMLRNAFYENTNDFYEQNQVSLGSLVTSVDPNTILIDDFDKVYGVFYPDRLIDIWKDYWTQPEPKTCAGVFVEQTRVRSGNQSMRYEFNNDLYEPYYSEVRATIGSGLDELDIASNWLDTGAKALTLWFYGQPENDANEQMYVKLTDGNTPANTAKIIYNGDMNDIRHPVWHKWNIPFTDFNNINLADVKIITIGFGDGNQSSYGTVFFDDISLGDGNPVEDDPHKEGQVFLCDDPFLFGVWGLLIDDAPPVINQHCALVNAGYGMVSHYPELIGKTTYIHPDSGIVDIGVHLYNPLYVNAGMSNLKADFNNDCIVDSADLGLFSEKWMGNYQEDSDDWFISFYKYDLNNDGIIDFLDFALFSKDWMQTGISTLPNIVPIFTKDPNNLNGYVKISYVNVDPRTFTSYVLIDGKFCGEFSFPYSPGEYPAIGIQTEYLSNGPHLIKVISMDYDFNIICSQATQVFVNNELSSLSLDNGYMLGCPFYFSASGSPSVTYTLEIKDVFDGNTTVYCENFTENISAVIPAEVFFTDNQFYELTLRSSGNLKFRKILSRNFLAEIGGSGSLMLGGCGTSSSPNPSDPILKCVVSVGSSDVETDCEKPIQKILDAARFRFGDKSVLYLNYGNSSFNAVSTALSDANCHIWIHAAHGKEPLENQAIEFADGYASAFESLRYRHCTNELPACNLNFVFFHSCFGAHTTQFAESLCEIHPVPDGDITGHRAFISWFGKAYRADSFESYNLYMIELFNQLQSGATLYDAKEVAQTALGVRGGFEISANLHVQGMVDGEGQYVHFFYPDIL